MSKSSSTSNPNGSHVGSGKTDRCDYLAHKIRKLEPVICESCGYSVSVHGDITTLKHCLEQVSLRLQRILKNDK